MYSLNIVQLNSEECTFIFPSCRVVHIKKPPSLPQSSLYYSFCQGNGRVVVSINHREFRFSLQIQFKFMLLTAVQLYIQLSIPNTCIRIGKRIFEASQSIVRLANYQLSLNQFFSHQDTEVDKILSATYEFLIPVHTHRSFFPDSQFCLSDCKYLYLYSSDTILLSTERSLISLQPSASAEPKAMQDRGW